MNSIGLHDFIYSPGLFVFKDKSIMIAACVDDILDQHMTILKNKFTLKELGFMKHDKLETDLLGLDLNYTREKGIIQLNITRYIEKMFEEYKEIVCKKKKLIAYLTFISMLQIPKHIHWLWINLH